MTRPYLCLDFGGTKLAVGVVDAQTGSVCCEARVATPVSQGAAASMRTVLAACDDVLARTPLPRESLLGVGISFGGPVSADRLEVIRSMHVNAWAGSALPARLSQHFELPAVMENDANAAALGEAKFGAGRGVADLLYVQVSTGIGAGIILGGDLCRGRGGAGEFGHVVAQTGGPRCVCGNRGCLETIAAGWALGREARRLGVGDSAEMLVAAARRGHEEARTALDAAFSRLGACIASAVNLLDPELVIVGGGISQSSDILLPTLENALDQHVVPHLRERHRLVTSALGRHAPLAGAAVAVDTQTRVTGDCGRRLGV